MTNDNRPITIWVLRTANTGDTNNRMAIAQASSPAVITVDFRETGHNVEQFLLRHFGVDTVSEIRNWPDVFITCEQETWRYAADLKRLSQGKVFIAGLQTPSIDQNEFDSFSYRACVDMQILFRHHDSALADFNNNGNSIKKLYDCVPTYITPRLLDTAKVNDKIEDLIKGKTVYTIALGSIVHPETAFGRPDWESCPEDVLIMKEYLRHLIKSVAQAARKNNGCVLVTTSRRTGAQFIPVIAEELNNVPHYIHDWSGSDENPYMGMLAVADHIVISGDSISMVSDAMAAGKPVYVYAPSMTGWLQKKDLKREFLETPLLRTEVKLYMSKLAQAGMIHSVHSLKNRKTSKTAPVNSAREIAADLLSALCQFKARTVGKNLISGLPPLINPRPTSAALHDGT